MVVSEPLSQDKGWKRVQPNSLVVVHEDLRLDTRTLET